MLVVAAALIAPDGVVLLQRRPSDAVHGGLWEFPGGKVSDRETPEFALVRELQEELGITIGQGDLEPLGFASGWTEGESDSRPLVILLYTCARWAGEPRCLDGASIDWFDPAVIGSLDMPPLDYPLARQLVSSL
ncbi:MAG: (deoxy)nucleoside triphosphate pyrophosphohydrolase [Novosphingobium sp.]|nr:(deoxy)nucleoside triphosphate pyrophosphohydrolase [Novosphingobium sp.]